ncbi:unnamed protein product [Hermetia illucens]|uniref:UDP-glucuronosyltransferase n=1 Tax=Hermetia illucens TaxID=343691 RepID=A0A7R8YUP0_HERIL|nr:UDP-glucosyltransferase 2-like [Hermetia illucens]CAD7082964.1 unnamed protein product [Hermetia illucens]
MLKPLAVLLVISIFAVSCVNCSNILVILSFPPPSHHLWNEKIVNKLAERGHNITVLSVHLSKTTPKNVHYIHLEKTASHIWQKAVFTLNDITLEKSYRLIKIGYSYMQLICEGSLLSDGFKTLQNYPEHFKFDLIIHDINGGPCLLGLLHKFGYPPLVGISAYKYTPELADIIGGHYFPGYIPFVSMPFDTNMTFLQRLENICFTIVDYIYRHYVHIPQRDRLAASFYNYTLPSFQSLEQRTTVALLNIHSATDFNIPLGPNVIAVGGLEVDEPKPLPKDLEQFISTSKSGAILICFGTAVDSSMFPDEKQQMILDVVRKFPSYNFIWKFGKDISHDNISNLLIRKWLPQNDILAHPNIKLFISHGGGLSSNEATWHGVPLVVVPFYLDQIQNSRKSVLAGVGKTLNVQTMTAKDLEEAIRSVLEDSSYRDRAKTRSENFRDRPQSPMDTAIWWIEYVLRHPNPTHLRPPTLDLSLLQISSCDVILFLILVLAIIIWIIYLLVKKLFKTLAFKGKLKKKNQ